MTYDLSNGFQRKAFLARCEDCLEKASVVELSSKAFRSRNQNSYLHLLIGAVAMETGETIAYVKDTYFKRLCNRDLFCVERKDRYCGDVTVIRSTKDLTKEEMSMAIDRFKKWGAENGIYLPNPGDESLLRYLEIEMCRNKSFLGG